jgi:cellulose synthase operon protein C
MIFGVAGVFFGLLVGWIIGSQQGVASRQPPAAATAQQQPQGQAQGQGQRQGQSTAAPLDESRAASLKQTADSNPGDSRARIELGNVYFDAERFDDAARWYQEALKIEPRNVTVSTDLGISYYYMNQPDRALEQFKQSLAIDPRHAKTLLNVGIVLAYGKEDLEGAVKAWQQVVDLGADTPEAKVARQALDAVRGAHPNVGSGSAPAGTPRGSQE